MKQLLRFLASVFLLIGVPVLAVERDENTLKVSDAQSSDTKSDKAMAKSIWSFADITVQYSPKPPAGNDQLMFFAKNEQQEIVVSGLGILLSGDTLKPSDGANAILRIRHGFPKKRQSPLETDADFVTEHDQSLFVMDARKKRMWEIGRIDGETLFRVVKSSGKQGKWQEFPKG